MVLVLANLLLLIKTLALAGVFFRPCHRFSHGSISYLGYSPGYSLSPGYSSRLSHSPGYSHGSGYIPGHDYSLSHGSGGREVTFLLKNH